MHAIFSSCMATERVNATAGSTLMNEWVAKKPGRGHTLRPGRLVDRRREIAVTDQWLTNLEKGQIQITGSLINDD